MSKLRSLTLAQAIAEVDSSEVLGLTFTPGIELGLPSNTGQFGRYHDNHFQEYSVVENVDISDYQNHWQLTKGGCCPNGPGAGKEPDNHQCAMVQFCDVASEGD